MTKDMLVVESIQYQGTPWFCSRTWAFAARVRPYMKCCVPGDPTEGDIRCVANFGDGSTCEIQIIDGRPYGRCSGC